MSRSYENSYMFLKFISNSNLQRLSIFVFIHFANERTIKYEKNII